MLIGKESRSGKSPVNKHLTDADAMAAVIWAIASSLLFCDVILNWKH